MRDFKYIVIRQDICHGKPVFQGTRIPVYLILDMLSAGETIETILINYPSLSKEAVLEAIGFASDLLKYEEDIFEIAS